MTAALSNIINKYQGVAPKQVISAVEKAARRTGADFSFLMEKASAESGFNPAAKSRHSTASGLFQFIESTWLKMVKDHGAKYGLGALAQHIQIRNGKPCVDNCDVKKTILNLRKNPEISALMAGEFSADNKRYLEKHTDTNVGAPELYLAHFMGAQGAAKFLNNRDEQGAAPAAALFPKEAHANKRVFFSAAGRPRSLDDIYTLFANKFNCEADTPSPSAPPPGTYAETGSTPAPAHTLMSALDIAQALPSFKADEIIWNDEKETESRSGFSRQNKSGVNRISAENILLMAQLRQKPVYNS